MRRNRTKSRAKPPLYPKFPVNLKEEDVRGADGKRIRSGEVVRCPSYYSEALKVDVPTRTGQVLEAYRREEGGAVVLLVSMDRDTAAAGTAALPADRCRRSSATIRGSTAEDWHGAKRENA